MRQIKIRHPNQIGQTNLFSSQKFYRYRMRSSILIGMNCLLLIGFFLSISPINPAIAEIGTIEKRNAKRTIDMSNPKPPDPDAQVEQP